MIRASLRTACLAAFVSLLGCASAGPVRTDPEPLTVFVAIDDASTARLGAFPVDRIVYARAIRAARALGAKGVALKFFFDRPAAAASDAALAEAASELPVLMQEEEAPQDQSDRVPPKLARDDWSLAATPAPLALDGVRNPIAPFLAAARRVGFVQARLDDVAHKVEIAGVADFRPIESLQLAIVELALGKRAIVKDNRLRLGEATLPLDPRGRVACDAFAGPAPKRYGIEALLDGKIPARAIRGKVVVLGYARRDSPKLPVAGREVPIHELFYRQVACLARRVSGS